MTKFSAEELAAAEEELFSGKPNEDFSEQQVRLAEVEFDNVPQDHERGVKAGTITREPSYNDAKEFFPGADTSIVDDFYVDPKQGASEENISNLLKRIDRVELQMEVARRKFDQVFSAFDELKVILQPLLKKRAPQTGEANFGL